jgi:mannitol-specific phosphotransferase system IIBC component
MTTIPESGTTPDQERAQLSELVVTSLVGGAAVYAGSRLIEFFEADAAVFFAYVLLLPLIVGAAMGARGWRTVQAAGVFVVAYLGDLVHDWIVTGGDQLFHLVLACLTGALAALAAAIARRIRRRGRAA